MVLHQHLDSLDTKQIEDEADMFASALLLPAIQFRSECPDSPDFNRLYHLKVRWKVSIAAMIMRGAELGVFSEWQKHQAFQKLNATGMRTSEKVPIPRENSRLHSMIFDALAKKGISPMEYAKELHLGLSELHELMPISKDFMPKPEPLSAEVTVKQRGHLRIIVGGKSTS